MDSEDFNFNARFDPSRLVPIDTTESKLVAVVCLPDDIGAKVIGRSLLKHFYLIGVIDECDKVTVLQNDSTLVFWVEKPVFDVHGHLEVT